MIDGAVRQYTEGKSPRVRVRVIGRREADRRPARSGRRGSHERERLTLNICFNFSGRAEIVDAAHALMAANVDQKQLDRRICADPPLRRPGGLDLVIRTRRPAHPELPPVAGRVRGDLLREVLAPDFAADLDARSRVRAPRTTVQGAEDTPRLVTALLLGPLILAIVFLGGHGFPSWSASSPSWPSSRLSPSRCGGLSAATVLGIMAGIALTTAGLVSANG
jgi:hypothetical protein